MFKLLAIKKYSTVFFGQSQGLPFKALKMENYITQMGGLAFRWGYAWCLGPLDLCNQQSGEVCSLVSSQRNGQLLPHLQGRCLRVAYG
jgi:hypothetical protein